MPIRIAEKSDAKAIAKIHVDTWQSAYVGHIPQDVLDGLSVKHRTNVWTDILSKAKTSTFVVTKENEIVGFVNVGSTRDNDKNSKVTGEIYAIYLDPNTHGEGFGRELFKKAVEYFKECNFSEFTLWVIETNTSTRGFYEAMGMTTDGATKIEEKDTYSLKEVRYTANVR
jgi:ribosomal protein S18 acetylase RimI-like enzyme